MPPDVQSVPHSPGQVNAPTSTTTPPSAMNTQQEQHPPQRPHSNSSRRSSRSFHTYNFPPTGQPPMQGHGSTSDNNVGVGSGPGPLRHPRPLTAAELHWQLEKEQEAVVNRLTRELAQLRQQSVSVGSTTSSTSAGGGHDSSMSILDPVDGHLSTSYIQSATAPAPPRHRRSSSGVSNRGRLSIGGTAAIPIHTTTRSQASIERSAVISRQNSVTSRRSPRAASPAQNNVESLPQPYYQHRPSLSSHHSSTAHPQHPHGISSSSPTNSTFSPLPPTTMMAPSRYEETALHRAELEAAMRENEALKKKIRELESVVRSAGGGNHGRGSSAGSSGRTGSRSGRSKDKEVDDQNRHSSSRGDSSEGTSNKNREQQHAGSR
ncbi:MAG: hypothetical protein M1816_000637 [Peltula sp. TS41687]|nr:MAG: hypothetical protein M1816_000637 [Peltula sp. TS41687]